MTANTTTPPITAPIITHGGPSKTDYKMGQIAPKASVLPGIDPCFVTFKDFDFVDKILMCHLILGEQGCSLPRAQSPRALNKLTWEPGWEP